MADSKCVLMGKSLKHKYAKNCLHGGSLSRLRSLHFTQNETTRLYSRISLVILPREPLGPVYTHADISLLIRNLCFGYLKKKKKDLRSINLWKLSSGMSQEELAS